MIVNEFETAIGSAKMAPKAAKTGPALWKALGAAGMRDVAAWGLFDLGLQMPCYKETILIYDDLESQGLSFLLPPSVT
jgi:hypothetical protein